jgi:hypothetical protein
MESKNISMQWVHISEDLQKGYNELEQGRYNFAHIVFDKVISINSNCGSAYLGKALAELEQKSLFEALENNKLGSIFRKLFFESDKICNAVLSDSELKNKLFDYAYNAAEYHEAEDAKLMLGFLEKHGYKDATSRFYMCESYEMLEKKAKKYREDYRNKIEVSVRNDETFPAVIGAQRLIRNDEELEKSYPSIVGELRRIDYYYQEAQIVKPVAQVQQKNSSWMSTNAWVIAILLFLFIWPAAIIYIIYRYSRYANKAPKPVEKAPEIDTERMAFLENKFYSTQKKYNELCEELRFTIETMLGEEIETFESEASSLGFMRGYGREILEKYSRI